MSQADWRTVGEAIIFISLVVGALGLLAKSAVGRPMRWIGRKLLVEPGGQWLRLSVQQANGPLEAKVNDLTSELQAVKKELHPNGGSSFRDEIRRNHASLDDLDRKIDGFVRHEFIPFAMSSRRDRAELHRKFAELRADPYEHLDRMATDLTSPPVGPDAPGPYVDEAGLAWADFPPAADERG